MLCGIDHADTEKDSRSHNSTGKNSDLQQKEQHLEALLRSADEAGQHRWLTAVSNQDMFAFEDDNGAVATYQADFKRLVLTALLRSVEVAHGRRSRMQRPSDEWWSKMDRKTAACLYDGVDVSNLVTPMDDQLRRAIDEDVQSEGGHRAVVLQGAEGTGRSTALRRFVHLVASSFPDLPPPVVVARRVSWPGRMAVDLLCDVVTQLEAVVNVADTPIGNADGIPAFIGHRHLDLDSLVRSYSIILRTFSESNPGRLVVALDGLENVRQGCTVSGGDIKWLAVPLPVRVHVIATYSPEPNTWSTATDVYGGRTVRTIDVKELSELDINHVVTDAFQRRRRRPPVDGRLSVIMQLIGTKPRAAYVSLLADEFAARSATTSANQDQLERPFERLENVEKIAKERFTRAERNYGKSVVYHC